MDIPTLLMAVGSAGLFTFLGQLVQSYVARKQGVDGASVDLQKSKLSDSAAFRVELQKRDTELNKRLDEMRATLDEWQEKYHAVNTEKTLLDREIVAHRKRVELLEEKNEELRRENVSLKAENAGRRNPPSP